jgi:endonuclease YncB( thermonuclease family)
VSAVSRVQVCAGRVVRAAGVLWPVGAAAVLLVASWGLGRLSAQIEPKVERPRPAVAVPMPKPGEDAPEEQLYVWPLPQQGNLTLLVLRVHDGDTCEAAVLVPVTVRLNGIDAPELNTEPGKASQKFLAELIGGRLLLAKLHGKEKYGRTLADFWLGKAAADPKVPSGWASEWMVKKGYARPYSGQGPRPQQPPAPPDTTPPDQTAPPARKDKPMPPPMKPADPADKESKVKDDLLERILATSFDAGEIIAYGDSRHEHLPPAANRRLVRLGPVGSFWDTADGR